LSLPQDIHRPKKICITGSNEKQLGFFDYYLLKKCRAACRSGGNVRTKLCVSGGYKRLRHLRTGAEQLPIGGMYDFKADLAILLNITSDHLDRYGDDLMEYAKAKFRMYTKSGSRRLLHFLS